MLALIIGVGSIGKRHVRNIHRINPNCQFVFLRQQAVADAFSRQYHATILHDINDAVALNPDFAVVATPTSAHIDSLRKLLAHDIPFYIEKPVVADRTSLIELEEIWLSLSNKPVTLMGCHLRYLPSLLELKKLVDSQCLGELARAQFEVGQWLPDWRPDQDYRASYSADKNSGGGVLRDLVHEFDMAHWLFGDMEQIKCIADKVSSLAIQAEDVACTVMRPSCGRPIVSISQDYISRQLVRCYKIVGDRGTAIWDFSKQVLLVQKADGDVEIIAEGNAYFHMDVAYINAMTHFIDSIKNHSQTNQSIEQGMKSLDSVLRAQEDAACG